MVRMMVLINGNINNNNYNNNLNNHKNDNEDDDDNNIIGLKWFRILWHFPPEQYLFMSR